MALENREKVLNALDAACWNVKEAAAVLGVSRQAVYDAMRRFGIERLPSQEDRALISERARRSAYARWRSA
jgi:DNA-binding NtrC family response regulator